jgi:hypothetical protein
MEVKDKHLFTLSKYSQSLFSWTKEKLKNI